MSKLMRDDYFFQIHRIFVVFERAPINQNRFRISLKLADCRRIPAFINNFHARFFGDFKHVAGFKSGDNFSGFF